MTNQNSNIIIILITAIIVVSGGFAAFNANIITIEAGQFAALLFATVAGLLTIASCTELQHLTAANVKSR